MFQAEVYKTDFEAERKAREAKHAEKEQVVEEMRQLQLQNQQLQDELQTYSTMQFSEMQRRHARQGYTRQTTPYDVTHVPTHQATPHSPRHQHGYPYGGHETCDTVDNQNEDRGQTRLMEIQQTPDLQVRGQEELQSCLQFLTFICILYALLLVIKKKMIHR